MNQSVAAGPVFTAATSEEKTMLKHNYQNTTEKLRRSERGFTLIEIVVALVIVGIMTAVAVPLLSKFTGNAKERAYNNDTQAIQQAVDGFYTAVDNTRYTGKRQYPILGASKTGGTFAQPDAGAVATVVTITGNPLGGSEGGQPTWVDDNDGVREAGEEVLNDEDTATTTAGWFVAQVTRGGTTYIVDTRDYFINFESIVTGGFMDQIPESASPDNKPTGSSLTYSGSYSWYVASNGKVKSLFYFLPTTANTGYQDVYP